ncbi:ferrochelatase [Chloroherpeton thalassium ATCC 35110]|uniref:Ferrochelatase n=1 Tax=Chloroherpeton thalassium (strain ATCC 35110 / GB-78) TaxID=517418 RepID=B3QY53_CHLT3|nr:ferrochelatase [Chloroherpeton thalassium]ACF15019.1 ferrochelatase [Chloroherpeton thalassium ATCC 35110]
MRKKFAVLISTYGEVEEPTIENLLPNSKRIIQMVTCQIATISKMLHHAIAGFRSVKRRKTWTKAGYQSRLNQINRQQMTLISQKIKPCLNTLDEPVDVDFFEAYYFVPPYLEDVVRQVNNNGYDEVIIISMLPIESAFSCGVACKIVMEELTEPYLLNTHVVGSLWRDEQLVKIFTEHVFSKVRQTNFYYPKEKTGLILAAHGTLVRDGNGNEPPVPTGLKQTFEFFDLIKREILTDSRNCFQDVKLGCLNHKFGGEWTHETMELAMQEFQVAGVENLALFPFGFFADNSEVDFEAKKNLQKSNFQNTLYIECVNDSEPFAMWLAEKIISKIQMVQNLRRFTEAVGQKA